MAVTSVWSTQTFLSLAAGASAPVSRSSGRTLVVGKLLEEAQLVRARGCGAAIRVRCLPDQPSASHLN
eukprot:764884-Hanusia_phi.AAC.6